MPHYLGVDRTPTCSMGSLFFCCSYVARKDVSLGHGPAPLLEVSISFFQPLRRLPSLSPKDNTVAFLGAARHGKAVADKKFTIQTKDRLKGLFSVPVCRPIAAYGVARGLVAYIAFFEVSGRVGRKIINGAWVVLSSFGTKKPVNF
jgi:hypothetical protein